MKQLKSVHDHTATVGKLVYKPLKAQPKKWSNRTKNMKSKIGKATIYVANRLWLICAIYFTSVIIASVMFSILEDKELHIGLWWSVVTSLTIGYGDVTPATLYGKIMAAFFGHFWVFLIIPMIVANLIMRAIENKNEFTDAEQKLMLQLLLEIKNNLDKTNTTSPLPQKSTSS